MNQPREHQLCLQSLHPVACDREAVAAWSHSFPGTRASMLCTALFPVWICKSTRWLCHKMHLPPNLPSLEVTERSSLSLELHLPPGNYSLITEDQPPRDKKYLHGFTLSRPPPCRSNVPQGARAAWQAGGTGFEWELSTLLVTWLWANHLSEPQFSHLLSGAADVPTSHSGAQASRN